LAGSNYDSRFQRLAANSLPKKLGEIGVFKELSGEQIYERLCLQDAQIEQILVRYFK